MAAKRNAAPQKPSADIGVIGLAVMGENLILNMERNGFKMACYNRTTEGFAACGKRRAYRDPY